MKGKTLSEYRRLKRAGIEVESPGGFEFHPSEDYTHAVSKLIVARTVQEQGWKADCEVEIQNQGKADVVAYAPDKLNYAIEVETIPDSDVREKKLDQYVYSNDGIDDMILVNITEVPQALPDLRDYLAEEVDLW